MFTYRKLVRKPSIFRSFTGLEISEFDSLYEKVETKHDEYERKRLSLRKRKRELGAGRPFKLNLKDRLLMLLVYYRLYVTFTLEGFLFDLDQSSIYRDVRILEPLVKECIPLPQKVYAMARRARTLEEVEKYFPGFRAFIDATEQEIPRPENKRRRKSFYSGKRKRHTAKTQLAVNSDGFIVHKTDHVRGRKHDYALYKEEHPIFPKEVNQIFDLGYKGIKNDFPGLNCTLPFKRAKGQKELPKEEKRFNRKLSRLRVVVEHTISRVKKFQIMGQEFRNRLKHYDLMTDIVSGLVNLRIIGNKAILP